MKVQSLGGAAHSSIIAWSILDRGAWRATVHRVAQNQTQLSRTTTNIV